MIAADTSTENPGWWKRFEPGREGNFSEAIRIVQAGAYNPTLTITAPSPFDAIYIGASAGGSSSATTTVEFTSVNDAL